ncbi:MAG: 4Fe-4S double cluster binding domain-containing protein [Promethearchaeota archaeon]|jgi:epoxyqueuosine reductase QueG
MSKINKNQELTEKVKNFVLATGMDIVGIADVNNDLFLEAPESHQPKNILEDAKSVIVFGKSMPRSIFRLNNFHTNLVHRAYHSLYKLLDITGVKLAHYVESLGYYSISIPSYNPLAIENFQPWGVISLKHAGLAAGLGKIAKNGLLIHPIHGTLLRLSAVITTADLVADLMMEENVCSECNLCIEKCPNKAFDKNDNFKKMTCLPNTVKHGINILHPYNQDYLNNIELISNTFLLEYTIGCTVCLDVCPVNKKELSSLND